MSPPRALRSVAWLVLASLMAAVPVLAQTTTPTRPFSVLMAQWSRVLDGAQGYLQGATHTPARSASFIDGLEAVRQEALKAKVAAENQIASLEKLLEALGPAPGKDCYPEGETVASKRQGYADDLRDYRARVALAELTATRASTLRASISALGRDARVEQLLQRLPSPLLPGTLAAAGPQFLELSAAVSTAPGQWLRSLPGEGAVPWISRFLALVAIAGLAGWALRRALLRRFGRDPGVAGPTYARRLIAALAEGISGGIVPAFVLGALLYHASLGEAPVGGLPGEIYTALLQVLVFLVLAAALTRAVLAPELPTWRLVTLAPDSARHLYRRTVALAGVFAVAAFVRLVTRSNPWEEALQSVWDMLVVTLEVVGILALTRDDVWRAAEPAGEASPAGGRLGAAIRMLAAVAAVASWLAVAVGYTSLGRQVVRVLLFTGIVSALLFLLRGLVIEGLATLRRSARLRRRLGLRRLLSRSSLTWLRMVLDPLLVALGVIALAPVLGVPLEELWRWLAGILQGFTVGNVTISPMEIALAVLSFFTALAVTRVLQRALLERVLPQTRLTLGAQHSIAAGASYLGVIIAATLGIAVLGIDMANIALVAGALSVGIGFGLQNVVNNFVSGLILLLERPVKVGDWVLVGDKEGLVKRISIRATELETFEMASVIIPNAEILSSAVTNLTHTDTIGRVDVRVGVAYGSATERVREILLECARRNQRVLAFPTPFVLFQDFGPSRLEFELRCYTGDVTSRLGVASDLRFDVEARLRTAGIEIPLPQQVVHMSQPEPAP